VSSNIGITKFASRLQPDEHFDALRAFGFGTPTGVEFPGEVPGGLPLPHGWRKGQQGPSVAMGYAFQVTPIQLAAAYGAIANDGLLLAPTIIKEIRDPSGLLVFRHEPLVVRRAVSPEVAADLRGFLALSAADSGTGGRAQVKGRVLGKTGTARLVENRRYTREYAASFAGIFPAKDPQLVVVVRVEKPKGQYYGGFVAAPLVGQMLTQALAARRTALDRTRLADEQIARPKPLAAAQLPEAARTWVPVPLARPAAGRATPRVVPNVIGWSPRSAALALHRRGFRVRLDGTGLVIRSEPAGGDSLSDGRTVTIYAARERTP
jgi:cell division protein FtsI (penicillin-binding protein 3)